MLCLLRNLLVLSVLLLVVEAKAENGKTVGLKEFSLGNTAPTIDPVVNTEVKKPLKEEPVSKKKTEDESNDKQKDIKVIPPIKKPIIKKAVRKKPSIKKTEVNSGISQAKLRQLRTTWKEEVRREINSQRKLQLNDIPAHLRKIIFAQGRAKAIDEWRSRQKEKTNQNTVSNRKSAVAGVSNGVVAEGRFSVTKLLLDPINEYPDQDITQLAIEELLEENRLEIVTKQLEINKSETEAVVARIVEQTKALQNKAKTTELNNKILKNFWALASNKKVFTGLSLDDLDDIAAKVTRYYRERGFFLAKAYIPAQDIKDGIVRIAVLDGRLGQVNVVNNKRIKTSVLENPFESLLGKGVTKNSVESALYALNDYPGLDVFASFSAGNKTGETALNLRVRQEKYWKSTLSADNYGAETTGIFRTKGDFEHLNITGYGDHIKLGVQQTIDPENSIYGYLDYSFPLMSGRSRLGISASTNYYVLGDSDQGPFELLDLSGESQSYSVSLRQILLRGRENNIAANIKIVNTRLLLNSDKFFDVGSFNTDKSISFYEFDLDYDFLWKSNRALIDGNTRLTYGVINKGLDAGQENDLVILNQDISLLKFVMFPFRNESNRMLFKFSGQYSNQVLPGISQFSLGGIGRVKAFTSSEFSASTGAYLSSDLYFNLPDFMSISVGGNALQNMLSPYLYVEGAYGKENKTGGNTESLAGWGVGLQFTLNNKLSSRLMIASPLSDRVDKEKEAAKTSGFFELSYTFN